MKTALEYFIETCDGTKAFKDDKSLSSNIMKFELLLFGTIHYPY